MNKIYKVIWSKVKHQYVVVSELAHSNGKQSRTAKRSLRSRIAALVVCGAIAAFGVFGITEQQAFAAENYEYIAFKAGQNDEEGDTQEIGPNRNTRYTYVCREVTNPQTNEPEKYWVREGYSIQLKEYIRFDQDDIKEDTPVDTVIVTTKGANASEDGLILSYQNVDNDMKVNTLNGNKLYSVETGMYGGGVNTTTTEVTKTSDFVLKKEDGNYVNVKDTINNNFVEVGSRPDSRLKYDSTTDTYTFDGEVVDRSNLYVLTTTETNFWGQTTKEKHVGVFVLNDKLYTGDVYGRNNEILMTGVNSDDELDSYWGTEVDDPSMSLSNMTMGQLDERFDAIKKDIVDVHRDNINKINVNKNNNGNGGTIGLQTNGSFDEEGNPVGDGKMIPGGITITSEATTGKDTKIRFANEANPDGFTVDAGSRVVGKTGADGTTEANPNDTLTGIEINGQNYKLGGGKTYTDGDGISISQDDTNTISVNTGDGLKIENDKVVANVDGTTVKTNEQGQLTATTLDEKGSGVTATSTYGKDYAVKDTAGNTVTIEDIASATKLEEVAGEAEKHTSVSTNDANLKVENTAQKGDAANYEVTLNKDLAVNSVTAGGENGTVINGNGLTVAGTQYVSAENGLNAGGKKIQNVAEGVGDKDAVNVSQLKKAIGDIDSYSGWTVTTNGGETDEDKAAVGSNGTVDFSADDANITIDQDGTNLKFGLANDLNVNKITTNNMYVTNVDTTTENNEYSVINRKYFNENEQHINPAEYEVQPDGTVTMTYVDGNGNLVKDQTATIKGLTTDADLAAAKTEVVGGKNATVTANTEPTKDGHTVYTVNAYDTQITGDSNVSVTGGELDENNVRNYNVKLADVITVGTSESAEHPVIIDGTSGQVTGLTNTDLKVAGFGESNRAATEEQLKAAMNQIDEGSYKGWTVTTNGGKTEEDKAAVASNGTVDFSADDTNITIDQNGTNLKFGLADDLSVNKITTNNMYVTNVDNNNNSSVVNVGYFKDNEKHIMPTTGDASYVASEDGTVTLKYADGSGKEIKDTVAKITGLASDKELETATAAAKTEVTGGKNITVGEPTTASDGHSIYTVDLADNVYLGGDNTPENSNITLDGTNGVIEVGSNIALDGRGTAVIGGVNIDTAYDEATGKPSSTITGLSNTTWTDEIATAAADKKSEAAGTAATQGQLGDVASDLSDQITNSGWTASTNNGAVTTDITNGDKVDFANTDGNIAVNQTAVKDDKGNITGTNLTFDLNPDITLDDDVEDGNSVQLSGTNGTINAHNSELIFGGTGKYDNVNDMTFNQNGLTITNTQTMRDTGETTTSSTVINGGSIATGNITAGGITVNADNGGTVNGLTNKTWDADNYVSGQAATEDQLQEAAAASKTTVSNGTNTTVTSVTDPTDGHVDYQVNLNDNVYLGGNNKPGSSNIELDGENGTIQVGSNIILDSKEARAVIGGVDISTTFDDIGKKSSTITGLSNTTWDTDKVVIDRAATEGQLQMVSDKVTAGWTATDDAGNKINVNPETRPTLNFASGKNITVSANEDSGEVEVSLNDNINLNNRVYINGDPEEGNNTIVDIKSSDTSKEESIFAVEDKGNGSISIGGIDITNVDGPYLAVGDGKLKFYKDGGLSTGNATGTFSVRPDGDLEINGKNSSFNVDAETGNVNAINNSGSAIMMNDDSVAFSADGNGVAVSDEGILLNTNGLDKDIRLVTKGTTVSVDKDGATFTNTNTNETTNINGGTINVGDKLVVDQDGTTTIAVNDGTVMGNNTTMTVNKDGVSFSAYGNGTTVIDGQTIYAGGVVINNNGSGTINGLTNTTWDDELAKQVANSEELQGTAATQGQLQQAVSAVATEAAKQHTTVSGDDNLTVKSSVNENGGTNYQVTLDDDITLGNPKAGNTEGERSFTINTTDPEGYVPESYKTGSGADFIEENGGFMLFATDTQGFGVFGVTAKGSAWAKDFKTYTTDIYGNNTQYSLNEIGDAVAQMSSYYNEENGKSYTVFSRYLNEAEKDNPFVTVDDNATRDIPLALRDDGAVLIGATIKGEDFTDNGIRINAETDADGNNKATITGLENTEWKPPTPVATLAANDGSATVTSRAATESQLNDLYSAVAAYDVNVDGTIDYSHIALAGAPYGASRAGNGTPTGGTSITNVAYASGKDGSEAVNVDYLNDAISDAAENGSISTSDQHLVANTETGSNGVYKPNDDGNVNLIVSDEKGNSSTITIGDVASKTELDSLKTNVGDLSYSKVQGDDVKDGDSVTTAIGKLDNKIENISGTATDADNNTVTGGKINSDGTISLTQKDKDSIKLEGQLTDSGVVQEGTSFDKETGTITITSQDKYSGETSSVKVEGIASTEVVGATNKEDLATAYKDADKDGNATTEYITDSESMVEADVALDHAIQDVAGTSYANDMVLSNRIDSVEKRLGNVEERIDKVGAMAAAIANLRTMGFDPEAPTEIAIGVGQYKSETGIAIGVFHYPNQDFMLSASLSSSGDELMGGIGATWKLGRKSAAERAKDEEARHLEQAEEMKKLAQQEKVKAQAQRHAKLLAERQQASQKNA